MNPLITDAIIDEAAQALDAWEFPGEGWMGDSSSSFWRSLCRQRAEAVLEAAVPLIAAKALEEAAENPDGLMEIAEDIDQLMEAATLHGSAENELYTPFERLKFALKALDLYQAEAERLIREKAELKDRLATVWSQGYTKVDFKESCES